MLIYKNNELSCISWEHSRNKQQVVSLLRNPRLCHNCAKWYFNLHNQRKTQTGPNNSCLKTLWPHWPPASPSCPSVSYCSASPTLFWLQSWAVSVLGGKKPQPPLFITPYLFFLLRNAGLVPCWAVGWDHLKFLSSKSYVPILHLCCYTLYYHDCLETSLLSKETEMLLPLSLKEGNWHSSKLIFRVLLKTLAYTGRNYCLSEIIPGKNWFDLAEAYIPGLITLATDLDNHQFCRVND